MTPVRKAYHRSGCARLDLQLGTDLDVQRLSEHLAWAASQNHIGKPKDVPRITCITPDLRPSSEAHPWKTVLMRIEGEDFGRFVTLIDEYSRRVCRATLEQHEAASISSPLAIWLLLAACASAGSDDTQSDLEEALGCSAADASFFLTSFLNNPPSAFSTALALWVKGSDLSMPLINWSASLPSRVERGPIPSQSAADAWVHQNTQGLITEFPLENPGLSRLILASTVATQVRWKRSFEVGAADQHLRNTSPWRGRLTRVLLDTHPVGPVLLITTESAGVVAVHVAVAKDDLAVISVAADTTLGRHQVLEAAHEVAALWREGRWESAQCSLFDLPVGSGHSWEITEHEVPADRTGERSEFISGAVLAAWTAREDLDLRASERFGIDPALAALLDLVGPHPEGDDARAVQSAMASYSTLGFEAAALAILDIMILEAGTPDKWGVERKATLFFDHPHAAIAVVGVPSQLIQIRAGHSDLFCLPVFSAWVDDPEDAQEPDGIEEVTLESWENERGIVRYFEDKN